MINNTLALVDSLIDDSDISDDNGSACSVALLKTFTVTRLLFSITGVLVNAFLFYVCLEFMIRKDGRRPRTGYTAKPSSASSRRKQSVRPIARPQYALNRFVLNGAVAALLASTIQTFRGVGSTFFDGDIILMLTEDFESDEDHPPADGYSPTVWRRVSEALMYMSTLFGPFAVAHFNFLLLLNVDKLLYILKPLQYDRLMNRRWRSSIACTIMWSFSLCWIPIMLVSSTTDTDYDRQLASETILIGVLYLVPTAFGLASAIVIAITVHRIVARDRRDTNLLRVAAINGRDCEIAVDMEEDRNKNLSAKKSPRTPPPQPQPSPRRVSAWRSLRTIAWTTIFSLPHPCVRIVLYLYVNDSDEFVRVLNGCGVATMTRVVANFSVAYLVFIPVMVICTYPPYRERTFEIWARIGWRRRRSRRGGDDGNERFL